MISGESWNGMPRCFAMSHAPLYRSRRGLVECVVGGNRVIAEQVAVTEFVSIDNGSSRKNARNPGLVVRVRTQDVANRGIGGARPFRGNALVKVSGADAVDDATKCGI